MKNLITTSRLRQNLWAASFVLILFPGILSAQSTKPALPSGAYTNSVSFDFTAKKFLFNYNGADTITYEYKPTNQGTFTALKCVKGAYTFNASNAGGFTMDVGGVTIYPWTAGVSFSLKSVASTGDTLTAKWRMSYNSDSLIYAYRFYIHGLTLVVMAEAEDAKVPMLTLDRCSNTLNPRIIPVPYLTLMNVLYTNNLFASFYSDWETTSASEISPVSTVVSATSVSYAQNLIYNKLTNGKRNLARETLYLTVSPKINDVFPSVPNPVSAKKSEAISRIVYDYWGSSFSGALNVARQLHNAGINNLWYIKHPWQNGGFDNKFPDVMPANTGMGGDTGLIRLSDSLAAFNYLFALHENYVDFYPNAPSWNTAHVGLSSNGTQKTAWFNSTTGIQSYLMKPTFAGYYSGLFSPGIHSSYNTTASYVDVHSSVNPSAKVDYDSGVANAGKFTTVLSNYRSLLTTMRAYHNGPVSGEGMHHFLYAGYVDDVEAQANTGSSGYWSGVRLPLLVDFQLQKLHPLMCAHGLGYYERFFSDTLGKPTAMTFAFDSTLAYAATELAYGNGSFIPGGSVTNLNQVARLEQKHVFASQQYYGDATAISIMYNDNGTEVDASEYIKRYPSVFMNRADSNFMSQVKIVYDNGMIVCVNRNMYKPWDVNIGSAGGWFNYHAIVNSVDSLNIGNSDSTNYRLPAKSGWVVYMPQAVPRATKMVDTKREPLNTSDILLWPVPSAGLIYLSIPASEAFTAPLTLYVTDMAGKIVLKEAVKQRVHHFTLSSSGTYSATIIKNGQPLMSKRLIVVK